VKRLARAFDKWDERRFNIPCSFRILSSSFLIPT
jgi:hypothetical protein